MTAEPKTDAEFERLVDEVVSCAKGAHELECSFCDDPLPAARSALIAHHARAVARIEVLKNSLEETLNKEPRT